MRRSSVLSSLVLILAFSFAPHTAGALVHGENCYVEVSEPASTTRHGVAATGSTICDAPTFFHEAGVTVYLFAEGAVPIGVGADFQPLEDSATAEAAGVCVEGLRYFAVVVGFALSQYSEGEQDWFFNLDESPTVTIDTCLTVPASDEVVRSNAV